MIRQLLKRLFPKTSRDGCISANQHWSTAEPGFYSPGYAAGPTNMEKVVCMKAFGDPKKLELMRAIAWHDLFGQGEPAGSDDERQAFREAYQWYVDTRWHARA